MILALAVVAASGCGGGTAVPPRLPHALGAQLAAQADAVEASLALGDDCGAAGQADRMRQMVAEAVAAGQVPAALRRPLSASVDALAGEIACTPAPPASPGPGMDKGKDKGAGHGDGKGHGHDHGGGGKD
jgi:hypothetical protein